MSNTLIATDGPPDPLDRLEGAGPYASAADVLAAARPMITRERFDPAELAFAAGGMALEGLGPLADPLGSLVLSPLVGWVIEHVAFVKEPFDQLAGDPGQIVRHARTWHNVAGRLSEVAQWHERCVAGLAGWRGEAGDAYRKVARRQGERLRQTAGDAEELAARVMDNGALVATVRSLIRDMIADFVSALIEWLVPALATASVTAGATLAPYVAGAVARACEVASEINKLLVKLFAALGESGRALATLARHGDELAGGEAVVDAARDALVEYGKQRTKADRARANWDIRPGAAAPP